MFALAIVLAATVQQEVPIETILNGNFERALEQVGTGIDIFGAFWLGAEGTDADVGTQSVVPDGAGNHVLRVSTTPGFVISQRVPLPTPKTDPLSSACPPASDGQESGIELAFKVRGDTDFSAYVSLIEDSGYHSAFHWHAVKGNFVKWDKDLGDYVGEFASDLRFAAWEPLQEVNLVNPACSDMTPDDNGYNLLSATTANGYNYRFATIERGYALQAIWVAPYDGIVRVFDRPAPFVATQLVPAGSAKPFLHELYYDQAPGLSCTPATVVSSVLADDFPGNPDRDGVFVTRRIEVNRGDRIVFRISNDTSEGTLKIQWRPALRYETYEADEQLQDIRGRRVTYYTGPVTPVQKLGETLVLLGSGVPAGTFTFHSGLVPQLWPTAKGPLDLELGSYDLDKNVEFDDVSCLVEFDRSANASALRAEFLEDVTQSRDNERYLRDRNETHASACSNLVAGPGQGGAVATPFVTHKLHVVNGPATAWDKGARPGRAADRQAMSFDLTDFLDLDFIDEGTARQAIPATLLDPNVYYNTQTDRWIRVPGEVAVRPELHLNRRLELGDVEELRRALEQCWVQAQNGVIAVPGPRAGAILGKGYNPVTGANSHVADVAYVDDNFPSHLVMEAPATMIATYVECAKALTAQPGLSSILDVNKMDAVWDAAAAAAQAGVTMKHYENDNAFGAWEGTWMHLGGYSNDTWGYGAKASWVAVYALDTLPESWSVSSATTAAAMKSLFFDDFIYNGAVHFLELWAHQNGRYAARAGDELRAWQSFDDLYDYMVGGGIPLDPTMLTTMKSVARESALCALKYQYPAPHIGGVWFSHAADEYQMSDLTGDAGGLSFGPELAISAAGVSLHSLMVGSTEYNDMLHIVSTLRRVTNLHFGREFGHEMGVTATFDLDVTAPIEARVNGAGARVIDALGANPTGAPSLGIPSGDLAPAPANFTFTVTADPAVIANVVNDRCVIGYWSHDSAAWKWTQLWTPGTGGPLAVQIAGGTATFTLATGPLTGAGELKFRVIAWTLDGAWSAKTSYQVW
jgi:hypothetical protein